MKGGVKGDEEEGEALGEEMKGLDDDESLFGDQ